MAKMGRPKKITGAPGSLNMMAREQHNRMVAKGFFDTPHELGTHLMLIVSELSEAINADRMGKHADLENYFSMKENCKRKDLAFKAYIKDTFEDEIADTFLRLLTLCGYLNLDIDTFVKEKIEYNETREQMNGKKY